MRFKNYLKYFLIVFVLAIIAVAVVIGINIKNKNKELAKTETSSTQSSIKESTTTASSKINTDFYSSSSMKFENYSFVSPKGWSLIEEKNGERVLLKNSSSSVNESIVVLVEKLDGIKDIKNENEIPQKYFSDLEKIDDKKDLPSEAVSISEIKSDIYGYEYTLLLEEKQKAVDLISYFKNGTFLYVIKYMSIDIDSKDAISNFKEFLKSFSLNSSEKNAKKPEKQDSVNILILGDDSAFDRPGGRVNGRTDIIIIFHLNLETDEGTIVTIPRDTWVSIPGHGDGKINGAHAIGGNELTVKTIEELSGLKIDNYIITDFDGFKPLIDFLGGVTVEVKENLSDSFSGCYLNKGIHHLNGEQALALCRNRHRNGEPGQQGGAFAREREAAKVILALYDQQTTFEKFIKMPVFVNYFLNYVWTDFTFEDVIKFLPSFGKINIQKIKITTIPSWPEMVGNASAVVYDKKATKELFEEIKNQ
ncbi:MAG: LCP family protein [Actinobacteria bacterium]|nr:LCP family protein [Actinomycetota bacterium]